MVCSTRAKFTSPPCLSCPRQDLVSAANCVDETLIHVFVGIGTVVNVCAVAIGSLLGLLLGHRFREDTRVLITQTLGLFTFVLGGLAVANGLSEAFSAEVGSSARLLIVLGALLVGALLGSVLKLEYRMDCAADWLRSKVAKESDRGTFAEAAVSST
ncbi:MAG: DUF554 family protein, partial [Propionibacteriaceae bacterium]|nr:DUF554 family protein [Propionibacteriaceae bacterium]